MKKGPYFINGVVLTALFSPTLSSDSYSQNENYYSRPQQSWGGYPNHSGWSSGLAENDFDTNHPQNRINILSSESSSDMEEDEDYRKAVQESLKEEKLKTDRSSTVKEEFTKVFQMSREQDELDRAISLSEASVMEEERLRDLTPDVFEVDGYALYFVNGNYYPVNTQDTLYVANIIKGRNRTSEEMVSLVVRMSHEEKYQKRDQVIAILKALYLW